MLCSIKIFTQVLNFVPVHRGAMPLRQVAGPVPLLCVHPPSDYSELVLLIRSEMPGKHNRKLFLSDCLTFIIILTPFLID